MKTINKAALIASMFFSAGSVMAQDNDILISMDAPSNGIMTRINFPQYSGIFSRSYSFVNQDNTQSFLAMGVYGSVLNGASSMTYGYIGRGPEANSFMTFKPDGNVGIGTTNPIEKLTINGKTSISSVSYAGSAVPNNISSINSIQINGSIPDASHNGITYQSGSGGGAAIGFYRGGSYDTGIDFYTNDVPYIVGNIVNRMRITYNGNIGIGTTTPTEKLSVNGKVRAKEIKVEAANWPDYVFDQDYKITSLAELEKFIKTNKHLPEMPTAKELEKDGVDLGNMIKLQQQKIEELTLHLIEKDKLISKEQLVNQRQESKLLAVEADLIQLKQIISDLKTKK